MTIGLQGEWGSGKTSLMKLVRAKLQADAKPGAILTFWFETWQYGAVGGSDALGMLLLRDLTDSLLSSIKDDPSVYKFRDHLGAAMRAALPAAAGVATSVVTRSERAADVVTAATGSAFVGDRSDIRGCFRELVDKALSASGDEKKRLVVFIDDLDRVPPVLAVRLLEVLKNFMDVPNCVFVVACDYDVVREGVGVLMGLSEDQRDGIKKEKVDAFFHKLFQVQFLMPVGAYKVDKVLRDYLAGWLKSHNGVEQLSVNKQKDWEKAVNSFLTSGSTKAVTRGVRADGWLALLMGVVESAVGTNPRALKRYLNLVDLTGCVDGAFTGESLAHWKLGSHTQDLATLRWCTALFPIVALQQRWPEVAGAWLVRAGNRSRPTSKLGDAAYTDFERRLRTIIDQWPPTQGEGDEVETQMEDETFRQQLREVFGSDIRADDAPPAIAALTDFAERWFRLLDNSAVVDDMLSDDELSVITAWSRRLGNMGVSTVRLTGIAKLRQECMKLDDRAGDGFVALASHLLHWLDEGHFNHVGGEAGRSSVWFYVRVHDSTRTLMVFHRKGDMMQVKVNATEHLAARWDLPGLGQIGEELRAELLGIEGVAAAHLRTLKSTHLLDFAPGHSTARNERFREVFSGMLEGVEHLALGSRAARPPAVGGTEAGALAQGEPPPPMRSSNLPAV